MILDFENLALIPAIEKKLTLLERQLSIGTEKRWLNSMEAAEYLGYSVESVHKMVQRGDFITSVHYHKRFKKLLFDKAELDRWVMGVQSNEAMKDMNNAVDVTVEEIMSCLMTKEGA